MTQREQLLDALARADSAAAERILAEAQNEPPLGTADGSISQNEWTSTWDLAGVHALYMQARSRFMKVWRMKTWLDR